MSETKTPQELLAKVRAHYQGLNSFSMSIHHFGDTGLYPGEYAQSLQWQRGGRFELRNTSPQNKTLREDLSPENVPHAVPDFLADGAQVASVLPSGKRTTDQVSPRPNSVPGWEVTGGMILSWLQDTPTGQVFLTPPLGMTLTWSFGHRSVWHGMKVRELQAHISNQGHVGTFSLFLNPSATMLAGTEGEVADGKPGYTLFLDQKSNPALPATLGSTP